jgi:N-acylglucosamine 2-epimerase
LDYDGAVFDTTKHVWLQGRQCYMYARVASEFSDSEIAAFTKAHPPPAPRGAGGPATPTPLTRAGLLNAARAGVEFLLRHAVAPGGAEVYFALRRDGTPACAQRKPFSAAFLILALSELAAATGEVRYRAAALSWLDKYLAWCAAAGGSGAALGKPGLPGAPPLAPLNEPMITLNLIMELARPLPRGEAIAFYAGARDAAVAAVLSHADPARRAVFEGVGPDGAPAMDTPAGRLLNPGHAIEAGWFLLDVAQFLGDGALRARALEVVQWAYEGGWDGPLVGGGVGAPAAEAAAPGALGQGAGAGSGGFIYFRDAGGFSPTQLEAHMKLWWPQAEAMVAFAKAWEATREDHFLEKFAQVAEWTYAHLVTDREWYGYSDRTGAVTHRVRGGRATARRFSTPRPSSTLPHRPPRTRTHARTHSRAHAHTQHTTPHTT